MKKNKEKVSQNVGFLLLLVDASNENFDVGKVEVYLYRK
jgi:hypothetical protein